MLTKIQPGAVGYGCPENQLAVILSFILINTF